MSLGATMKSMGHDNRPKIGKSKFGDKRLDIDDDQKVYLLFMEGNGMIMTMTMILTTELSLFFSRKSFSDTEMLLVNHNNPSQVWTS